MADDTSHRNPIRVDFVDPDALQAPGRLGLTFAPGKKGRGSLYGVAYDRDLHADLMRLKEAYQTKVLVSLMEPFEYELLGIGDLFERAEGFGIEVLAFPIRDVSTPRAEQDQELGDLIKCINDRLARGQTVVVHCRGGVGRSGLVASAVLVTHGHEPAAAIDIVRSARPGAVETPQQEQYVHGFATRVDRAGPV